VSTRQPTRSKPGVDVLSPALPTLDAELDVLVHASYRPAFAALRRLGLGIDSVQLVGDVDRAFERLGDAPLPRDCTSPRWRRATTSFSRSTSTRGT
jgi:hypothetical protein